MSLFHTNTLLGASGSGGDPLYVDDVFSVDLWDGTGSTQTITNGIDLAGEGGMVWTKAREVANENHMIHDSERGKTGSYYDALQTNVSNADYTDAPYGPTSFNSDGFTLGGNNAQFNGNGDGSYCSWTFRKCPGFFDIVTWTGNGSNRTISHSIGSTPGFIIVKRTSNTEDWTCWHRSLGATKYVQLNGSNLSSAATLSTIWNDTEPTSTVFSVGTHARVNTNGETYVAYIFAHDDQSFGTDSDEAIIKCGTFVGASSPNNFVNIGFEPQFLITKQYDDSGQNWEIADIMRGAGTQSGIDEGKRLFANTADDEEGYNRFSPKPTGFDHHVSGATNDNFIYIAIRRPHKPPEAGTDVFKAFQWSGNSSSQALTVPFAPDLMHVQGLSIGTTPHFIDILRGRSKPLVTSATDAEYTAAQGVLEFREDGAVKIGSDSSFNLNGHSFAGFSLKRAPGFFDMVAWAGDGTSNRAISHNLTVTPELLITKRRTNADGWWSQYTGIFGTNTGIRLDQSSGLSTGVSAFNSTSAATSSVFYIGSDTAINGSSNNYIAYLFATLDGISKVGSYSGTGNNVDVDCGFTAGARFILIKRTDSTGDWYWWDSVRGIIAGNDPYARFNVNANQVTNTDYIDPLNSGFTVTSSAPAALNASGGNYIFLAIA